MIPFPNKKYNIIYADPPWSYRVCPRSPRMAGFIDFTAPGENVPKIKTSPRWCPLRTENKEAQSHE